MGKQEAGARHTDDLAAVEAESLTQLDKGNGKGSPGDLARDTREVDQVLVGGLLADHVGIEFDNGPMGDAVAGAVTGEGLLLANLVQGGGELGLVAHGQLDRVLSRGRHGDGVTG